MNTEQSVKLYHGITNIREDILEEAQCVPVCKKKRRWVRWVAVAACLCLIVGTTAALTTTEFGTRLIRSFRLGVDSWESGYDLSIGIEKISAKGLTGDIRDVPAQIRQQYQERDIYSSWFPGSWQKKFSNSAEAREFIGYEGLKGLSWELEEGETTLRILGDSKGNIQTIGLETAYQVGDIRMQAFSRMYTERYSEEVTIGSRTTEYVEFTESFYTTQNGKQCHVISGTAMESGVLCMDGYLVEDGVLYNLHIMYQEEDAEQAKELLYQWAELF